MEKTHSLNNFVIVVVQLDFEIFPELHKNSSDDLVVVNESFHLVPGCLHLTN